MWFLPILIPIIVIWKTYQRKEQELRDQGVPENEVGDKALGLTKQDLYESIPGKEKIEQWHKDPKSTWLDIKRWLLIIFVLITLFPFITQLFLMILVGLFLPPLFTFVLGCGFSGLFIYCTIKLIYRLVR